MRMNGMENLINIEEFTRELESVQKPIASDRLKAIEQSRQIFIMDADKWTKADKKKLMTAELSLDDIVNLELFYDMWYRFWATSLITKKFLRYKDNMPLIMEMHRRLKEIGLITPTYSLDVSTLDKLTQLILTEQDFIDFTEIYEDNKYRCGILMWIKLYKDGKELETKDGKSVLN